MTEAPKPPTQAEIQQNRLTCLRALWKVTVPKICGSFTARHWGADGPDGPVIGCCAMPVFADALGIIPLEEWGKTGTSMPVTAVIRAIDCPEGSVYTVSDSTETFQNAAKVFAIMWDIPTWIAEAPLMDILTDAIKQKILEYLGWDTIGGYSEERLTEAHEMAQKITSELDIGFRATAG